MPRLAKLLAPLIIIALTLVLFDLIGYFLVPASYTTFAPSYRNTRLLSPPAAGLPELARNYPRYYHRADDVLGFDITPGARAMAEVDDHPYEIFANQLGCFDRKELRDFQGTKEYFYFAGDSATWGYAPYESKFATVWERETGKLAAKCGVTHSGTLHEFEKFKRTAAVIGKYPKVVFVGFTINDPANDLAYPHTTVIDGYQVDVVFLKDGVLVRPNIDDIRQTVESSIHDLESAKVAKVTWFDRLKTRVWVYSLSANIVNYGALAMGNAVRSPLGSISLPAQGSPSSTMTKFGDSFYWFFSPNDVKTRYLSDPRSNPSKEAIGQWARHARDHSYKLVFLLLPPKSDFNDVDLFTQVKAWLDVNGIEYVDFAQIFKKAGYKVEDLYWTLDGHWNENGNRIVGRLLSTLSSPYLSN